MIANASSAILPLEWISSYQQAKSLSIDNPSVRSVSMKQAGDNDCMERQQ